MRTLAIIGTAGRQSDAPRMSREIYDCMYADAVDLIERWEIKRGVSGGAAWADHVCVRAFLEGKLEAISLYLPAHYDGVRYIPNPKVSFNPGDTSNRYHAAFSAICGIDSLAELGEAISRGAHVEVHEGFKRRNLEVAGACTHMQAYTFGADREPSEITSGDPSFTQPAYAGLKDGGTAFHGLVSDAENRRKVYDEFGPDDEGFRDSRLGGLRDGGTAHTWTQCWRADVKRHVNLFRLQQDLANRPSTLPTP